MNCPSCGHDGMLFDNHHGMEHNVCQQCGTVIECVSLVVDTYVPGAREVSHDTKSYKYGMFVDQRSKGFTEGRETLNHLMDTLNLPISARELAMHFFKFTKSLDKHICVGACVYLAMKRHDLPVTIKYISNYLQVSHFAVGKIMKKLEKRIGESAKCSVFSVDRLAHLIFNQAKFGGSDGGKKRYDLLLNKTEQLLQLLLEYQTPIGYQPHIIVLAAGYIVWRNLISHGWRDTKDGSSSCNENISNLMRATVKSFLCEVGIQLPSFCTLYEKINSISNLLIRFAGHIPWISGRALSKDMIYFHLDDFLKYKSQMISLTAQVMSEEKVDIKIENLNELEETISSKSDQTEQNVSSVLGDCKEENANHSAKEDFNCAILNSSQEEETPKSNFSINLNSDVDYAPLLVINEPVENKEKNVLVFRKVKYTKVTSLRQVPYNNEALKKCFHSNDKTCKNSKAGNSCNQVLEITSPMLEMEESYETSLGFP